MDGEKVLEKFHAKKKRDFLISLGVDLLGMASFIFPGVGEITDAIFAPISGIVIYALYKQPAHKLKAGIAAAIGTTEEALPLTDVLPTATLMWLKTYILDKNKALEAYVKERNAQLEVIKNT